MIKIFLNPKGHKNAIGGSKVTAILLMGWILPIGGASAREGLRSMLVLYGVQNLSNYWGSEVYCEYGSLFSPRVTT